MIERIYYGSYSAGVAVSLLLKQHGYSYIDMLHCGRNMAHNEYSWYTNSLTCRLHVVFNDPQVETLLALQGDLEYV